MTDDLQVRLGIPVPEMSFEQKRALLEADRNVRGMALRFGVQPEQVETLLLAGRMIREDEEFLLEFGRRCWGD